MGSFDKLMGDIYNNFDNEEQQQSAGDDLVDVPTEVIENQVAVDEFLDEPAANSDEMEVPQAEEQADDQPNDPIVGSTEGEKPALDNTSEISVTLSKDGQYSLFGEDDLIVLSGNGEDEENGCKATPAPKTSGSKKTGKKDTKAPSAPVKPKEELKVTAEWTLHYSTLSIRIGDLFPDMTDTEEKTLEEVRQKMEESFFQFTRSRVKWDYDKEEKRLYPDVFATSKGADFNTEIGARLKRARQSVGMDQLEVAAFLGIDKSTISRYESGERTPDVFTIGQLAELYRVTTDFLISGMKEIKSVKLGLGKLYLKVDEYLKEVAEAAAVPHSYITSRDGRLYEARESHLGRLVVPAAFVPSLDEVNAGFRFSLPKIPGRLLSQTLSFFRAYCSKWQQNEVMTLIYWDILEQKYILECPYQEVSKVRIDAQFDEKYIGRNSSRFIPVMHIHSHNMMKANFSPLDNQNELSYMLYMVVGQLDQEIPAVSLRVGCNGSYINNLPIERYFNLPILNDREVTYPVTWDQRVTIL